MLTAQELQSLGSDIQNWNNGIVKGVNATYRLKDGFELSYRQYLNLDDTVRHETFELVGSDDSGMDISNLNLDQVKQLITLLEL